MKIAVISDLHGNLIYYPSDYWKELKECETLFICGDIIPLNIQFNMNKSQKWLIKKFKPWALDLPVEKVFIIGGNHDAWFERNEKLAKITFPIAEKITYLHNEWVYYISTQDSQIYKIFGTPYCHIYGDWPFMRHESVLKEKFGQIPNDVDILFSHDAPYGVSDICLQGWSADEQHKGCTALKDIILEKQPKYCFHGHLHSSNHEMELLGQTQVYNTSILDEEYKITYYPLYIQISKKNTDENNN